MHWIQDDLTAVPAWHAREGDDQPPDTPGLAVELDPASMAGCTVG